jgi:hypothetical protein
LAKFKTETDRIQLHVPIYFDLTTRDPFRPAHFTCF